MSEAAGALGCQAGRKQCIISFPTCVGPLGHVSGLVLPGDVASWAIFLFTTLVPSVLGVSWKSPSSFGRGVKPSEVLKWPHMTATLDDHT